MKAFFSGMPKTGTQTIHGALDFFDGGHDMPHEIFQSQDDDVITFMNVRNPLSYYVSEYNFQIKTSGNDPVKDYGTMDNNTFDDFFVDRIQMKNLQKWMKPNNIYWHQLHFKYSDKNIGFYTLAFIFYTFLDFDKVLQQEDINQYLKDNFDDEKFIKNHLRLENLQEEYNELANSTELPLVQFGIENSCPHKKYIEYYDKEKIEKIYNLDKFVFDRFYKKEIEEILK